MSTLDADNTRTGAVLEVRHLTTHIRTGTHLLKAVDDVTFSLQPGEIMGLVGESGSGKSMTAYSILGLLDPPAAIACGEIRFQGQDMRRLSAQAMRQLRGNRIAMIFQDASSALNPVLRIDTQMMEAIQAHQTVSSTTVRVMARDALARVGISSPDERLRAYPHQFSGGMRQRVAIAIALLNKPNLIICDEPTTALDVTTQAQILMQMRQLCRESGSALLWITHDLAVVAELADSLSVMYAGKIVESGATRQVLKTPRHPYTNGLIKSSPSRNRRGEPLAQIPGSAPSLQNVPSGCPFRDRCERASALCRTVPPKEEHDGRTLRCFYPVPYGASANEALND